MLVMDFVASSGDNPDGFQIFCNSSTDDEDNTFYTYMKDYANDLAILYDSSDKWMCSRQCPCKPENALLYDDLTESEVNVWGRTLNNENDSFIPFYYPEVTDD